MEAILATIAVWIRASIGLLCLGACHSSTVALHAMSLGDLLIGLSLAGLDALAKDKLLG